jgi:DNA repair protein RadA/Sms
MSHLGRTQRLVALIMPTLQSRLAGAAPRPWHVSQLVSLRGWHAAPDVAFFRPPAQRPAPRSLVAVRAASSSARPKQLYKCRECGETTLQWSGQCMSCKAWSSLEKMAVQPAGDSGGGGGGARAAARFAAGRPADAYADAPPPGAAPARRNTWVTDAEAPQRLSDVARRSFRQRWRLQLPGESGAELGRVLGGGVVPGSLVLVGGEPGVGKSTLLLQVADMLTAGVVGPSGGAEGGAEGGGGGGGGGAEEEDRRPVLYVSGEESAEQIGSRAERMGVGSNPLVYLYRRAGGAPRSAL